MDALSAARDPRSRRARAGLAAVVALALLHAPAFAAPEIAVTLGRSFAVDSPSLTWQGQRGASEVTYEADKPDGGFAVAASVLWPWEDRFRFGFTMHAVDAGAWQFDEADWRTVQGGEGGQFGLLELGQLDAWGGSWRTDILGPAIGGFADSYASVSYGIHRWRFDRSVGAANAPAGVSDSLRYELPGQATTSTAQTAIGATLALGVERSFGPKQTFALSISGTALTSDFTRRFLGAHLEWRWRL